MKRNELSKTLQEPKLNEWECRVCKNRDCVYSPVCNNLPIPKNITDISPLLQSVIQLMRNYHHHKELRLIHIAIYLDVSVRELQILFANELKCIYSEHLRNIRAGHAKRLTIEKPSLSIKQLMDKVGFQSYHGYSIAQKALEKKLASKSPESQFYKSFLLPSNLHLNINK